LKGYFQKRVGNENGRREAPALFYLKPPPSRDGRRPILLSPPSPTEALAQVGFLLVGFGGRSPPKITTSEQNDIFQVKTP
jgi:hypothetical protein